MLYDSGDETGQAQAQVKSSPAPKTEAPADFGLPTVKTKCSGGRVPSAGVSEALWPTGRLSCVSGGGTGPTPWKKVGYPGGTQKLRRSSKSGMSLAATRPRSQLKLLPLVIGPAVL